MANIKAIITDRGRNILTQNIAMNRATIFHQAMIGDGVAILPNIHEIQALVNPIKQAMLGDKGIVSNAKEESICRIPVQITNQNLDNILYIREIGIFTKDINGNDVLFAYGFTTEADDSINTMTPPMINVSDTNQIRIIDMHFHLSDADYENITITISASALLTWSDMIAYAAPIKHRHTADEIDESIGVTTEEHQRAQDNRLDSLETLMKLGSKKATSATVDTKEPLQYKIINDRGYYDKTRNAFIA